MTDDVKDGIEVFDLGEFLQEIADSSRRVFGRFIQVEVSPGYWAYAPGVPRDKQFYSIADYGKAGAQNKAKAIGGNPRQAFRFTQFANTSIVDEEYSMTDNWVNYIHPGEFPFPLWAEHSFNGDHPLSSDMFGKQVWAHVESARHPDFNEDDPATHTSETIRWDFALNAPKLADDGSVRPMYYAYVSAAFHTREELVDYAASVGVEVGESTDSIPPAPAGWLANDLLNADDWKTTVPDLVGALKASGKPKPLAVKELLKDWEAYGLTAEDLGNLYDKFVAA